MSQHREIEGRFLGWLREYRGIFLKFTRAYARDSADQADLLQEMSVQLWRSAGSFRGQCAPSTWIYRVCLNTALGWQRGQRRRPLASAERERIETIATTEPRPGWSHEESELLAQVYEAMRGLPEGERSVLLLSLEEMSYREIAEITGLSEGNVGVMLTRARARLSEKLQEVRNEL